MTPWLIVALLVAGCWLLAWAICRAAARADAEEAQCNLINLLAEQADERERADAAATDAHLGI